MAAKGRAMKLRPHHIMCVRFFNIEPPGRGGDFENKSRLIRAMMSSEEEPVIEITRGADELCAACPSLGENGCANPFGDEEKVERWDARVMVSLGIAYGEVRTAGELRRLIDSKRPLTFCKERCPWKTVCAVFDH